MKLFPAILLSGLLALTLAGCTAQSTSGGVSAAASALDATANASPIQIKLNRVKDEIKAEDGHVLVSYAYDRPTVIISGNSAAQSAIQSSLNALVDKDLTYVKGDLYAIAQGNYQALGKDATPCTSELNLTVTDYLCLCGLGKQIVRVDGLDEILAEVKAQGRNLNQLTTLANMGRIQILRSDELIDGYADLCQKLLRISREVQ